MSFISMFSRRGLVLAAFALVAGCGTFDVAYDPVSPGVSQGWTVRDVRVATPDSLVINTGNAMVPNADVVWHGDSAAARVAGAAAIVKAGILSGTRSLNGARPVVMDVTLTRFHALTDRAYYSAPPNTGTYSVGFIVVVRDARTGEVLSGPDKIEADRPAPVLRDGGVPNEQAAVVAQQKADLTGHIAGVVRGWLGIGPDRRGSFTRAGA